jgi:hypothetical protein
MNVISPDLKQLAAPSPHSKRIRDEVEFFMRKPDSLVHTVIIVLANAYIEVVCADMYLPEIKRHWVVRRTVDLSQVAA